METRKATFGAEAGDAPLLQADCIYLPAPAFGLAKGTRLDLKGWETPGHCENCRGFVLAIPAQEQTKNLGMRVALCGGQFLLYRRQTDPAGWNPMPGRIILMSEEEGDEDEWPRILTY